VTLELPPLLVMAQRGAASGRELRVRWKGNGAEDDQRKLRKELQRTAPEAVADLDATQGASALHAAQLRERPAACAAAAKPPPLAEAARTKKTQRRVVPAGELTSRVKARLAAPPRDEDRCTAPCDGCPSSSGAWRCAASGQSEHTLRCLCQRSREEPFPQLCAHCKTVAQERMRSMQQPPDPEQARRLASLRSAAAVQTAVQPAC
jgi:hypothetical protein